jgi:hypothetical protein
MLYAAYRIDVMTQLCCRPSQALVADELTVARCVGSLPDRSCTFDQFMRHIIPDWTGSTNVGNNMSPDLHSTAAQLRSDITAGRWNGFLNFDTLFPQQTWR